MAEDVFYELNDGMVVQSHPQFEVAIICAIFHPELTSVLDTGEKDWQTLECEENDPARYYATQFVSAKGSEFSVVAAAATQMGMASASVLATKMIIKFRPRIVVMVGIAAGSDSARQNYGDILAASMTFDYGAGKELSRDGTPLFQPDPYPIAVQPAILTRLMQWDTRNLKNILERWAAKKGEERLPAPNLHLHVGPIASGSAVIDRNGVVEAIKSNFRKLIGIEMEAYGVHRACQEATKTPTAFICLKSICDFAASKEDKWQSYSAFTAAQYCHEFLTHEWEGLCSDTAAATMANRISLSQSIGQ